MITIQAPNTVTVEDDGAKVVVTSGDITTETFTTLQDRVTELESGFDEGVY